MRRKKRTKPTIVCTSKDRSSQLLEAILQEQGAICCY
jgi:hypothetical protein